MKEYTKLLLEQVAYQPEGAKDDDPVKYRDNVIEWMKAKVVEALEYESIDSDIIRSPKLLSEAKLNQESIDKLTENQIQRGHKNE